MLHNQFYIACRDCNYIMKSRNLNPSATKIHKPIDIKQQPKAHKSNNLLGAPLFKSCTLFNFEKRKFEKRKGKKSESEKRKEKKWKGENHRTNTNTYYSKEEHN